MKKLIIVLLLILLCVILAGCKNLIPSGLFDESMIDENEMHGIEASSKDDWEQAWDDYEKEQLREYAY